MRGLSKLTHRFADTCCFTNLKSNILTSARCGINLNGNRLKPSIIRKRAKKHCCPADRNDIRLCPKCKKLNDTIWTAHKNTGLWVDDDALKWFESQQDTRRRKHDIYEEYMNNQEQPPLILYTKEGIQFIPPPVVPKKETKNRLDANKFKRISPEFLKLLQRHHDSLHKNYKTEQEPDPEITTDKQKNQPKFETQRQQSPREVHYLKRLNKLETVSMASNLSTSRSKAQLMKTYFKKHHGSLHKNYKAEQESDPKITSDKHYLKRLNKLETVSVGSNLSTSRSKAQLMKTYFKKHHHHRNKGGKDRSRSSITYLKTFIIEPPNASSNKPKLSTCKHICSIRHRAGKEAPLQFKVFETEVAQEKPCYLDKPECSKALTENSLRRRTPLSKVLETEVAQESPSHLDNAECLKALTIKPLRRRTPLSKVLGTEATQEKQCYLDKAECSKALTSRWTKNKTPLSPHVRPVINRLRYRQKGSECRGRYVKSVNKTSIPQSYKLVTVGDPFKSSTITRNFWQFRDRRHMNSGNTGENTLKEIDSDISIGTSSCYDMKTVYDPFKVKSLKHSFCHLGTNTPSTRSLTPAYSYARTLSPSTSSVQTQTKISSTQRYFRESLFVTKSTQTLLEGSDSFPYLEVLTPESSEIDSIDSSKDSITTIKSNPSASKRSNYYYPRI